VGKAWKDRARKPGHGVNPSDAKEGVSIERTVTVT
jgi:hypothetical protein